MTDRDLVLVHGGNGSPGDFRAIKPHLEGFARVHEYVGIGHAGRPVATEFTVEAMVNDLIDYLDEKRLERAFIFGYSFAGYKTMHLARRRPDRVRGVITLGARFLFDDETLRITREATKVENLEPYDSTLAKRHYPRDWRDVARANMRWLDTLVAEAGLRERDYRAIRVPALLLAGDNDHLSSAAETEKVSKLMPLASYNYFKGTAHPISATPFITLAKRIGGFMDNVEAFERRRSEGRTRGGAVDGSAAHPGA